MLILQPTVSLSELPRSAWTRAREDVMYNHLAAMSRRGRHKVLTMIHFIRRSLLTQLIGVYLVFVLIVIGSGMEIDAVGQHQIRDQIQTTDFALAQEIAFETFTTISDTETSLVKIEWAVAGSVNDPSAMESMFTAFMASRQDIDRMYWLDASGIQQVSVPRILPRILCRSQQTIAACRCFSGCSRATRRS